MFFVVFVLIQSHSRNTSSVVNSAFEWFSCLCKLSWNWRKYFTIGKITDIKFNLNENECILTKQWSCRYTATKQCPAKSSSMMIDWQVEYFRLGAQKKKKRSLKCLPGWSTSVCYKNLLDFHHWRIDTSCVHDLGPESGFTKSSKGNFKYILTLKDWKGVIQCEWVGWFSLAPNIVMHTQLSLMSSACDTQDKWCSQLSWRIWGFYCRSIAASGLWLKETPNHHYFNLYSDLKRSRIIWRLSFVYGQSHR